MYTYIAFNKPFQVLCQFSESDGKRTLAEFNFPKGIYPVGRLDYDSEGLLLLTDDKSLTAEILDPTHNHERAYWAQVEKIPTLPDLTRLEKGVVLGDFKTKACKAKIMSEFSEPFSRTPPIRTRKSIPTAWLELTLTEGKNRQVRRMCALVGFPVLRLIRHRIKKLCLNDLQLTPGDWVRIEKKQMG